MAHLFQQKKSPFWWVCYTSNGKRIRKSTHLRVGVGSDTRKAKIIEAEHTLAESKTGRAGGDRDTQWDSWVGDFLEARYSERKLTCRRYKTIWNTLRMFMSEREILTPIQLTREHCMAYLNWRKQPKHTDGKYHISHNTAILELKVLRLVLTEAVRREWIPSNPANNLRIERVPPKEKPALSDETLDAISAAIDKEKDAELRQFYRNSFEIARWQGCRLNETYLNPMTDVQINTAEDGTQTGTIKFRAKGNRTHTAPLHPQLIPLFTKLQSEQHTETWQKPFGGDTRPSRLWWNLLKRGGFRDKHPGICFHCLRVTAATRLVQANVSEAKAMRFIGHASTTVHRMYQRLQMPDLEECFAALGPRPQANTHPGS